ncbi:MAG: divalent cation tolerance protein CutA [Candidatus Liptonbacteria bacterium]|nr:divalent cation tolerance protein CutA [Candidatus Liptonbacteria bacterium]
MVLVYTTCQTIDEAKELGRRVLKARVASGVDIWPITTIAIEGEELKELEEAVLFIRTNENKLAELEEFLEKRHTHSVPFVAGIDVRRLNRTYREWMSTFIVR